MNHSIPSFSISPGLAGLGIVFAAAVLGGGCATTYRFTIDAVQHRDAAPTGPAYVLANHTPPGAADDLAFAAAARDIRSALSSKGWFEAPAGVHPHFEVEVDFGLEGPVQKTLTHTEPVYATASSAPRAMGRDGADDMRPGGLPRKIGDRTVTTVVTTYRKFLRLTARAARSSAGAEPRPVLWSVVVTNDDEASDLGRYVRLMTAAAMDLIDADTGTERSVVLTNRDGRVVFIEQGV